MNNPIDFTQIIVAVIGLLSAIITTVLVPYIKTRVSADKLEQAKVYAKIAVEAAEMLWKDPKMGTAKKEYVKEYLAQRGYTFDETELDVLIESAVLELKKSLGGAT